MSTARPAIRVRHAVPSDAAPLCEILNTIIKIGGTTALEIPLSLAEFSNYFLEGERFLSCFVAEDSPTSRQLGFQGLSRHPELPEDWADIGTFVRSERETQGVGTALFARTKTWADECNLAAINAAIRADNRGGLAYYEKMGFRNYQIAKEVPLRDGTPVDRIFKCYLVNKYPWSSPACTARYVAVVYFGKSAHDAQFSNHVARCVSRLSGLLVRDGSCTSGRRRVQRRVFQPVAPRPKIPVNGDSRMARRIRLTLTLLS